MIDSFRFVRSGRIAKPTKADWRAAQAAKSTLQPNFGQHMKAGSHAGRDVARHVTVEKPDIRTIGNHVGGLVHAHRQPC
jgi:hypothetical protein